MEAPPDATELLRDINSDVDGKAKMAVFKLQAAINDPSFADRFISIGGLSALRRLILNSSGNTLAYALQSLTRLLEVDMGWEIFEPPDAVELVERLVDLIVSQPLVNILRGAMSILVAVVSHPQVSRGTIRVPGAFGFRALKPAVAVHPQFFEMVVSQLNSADHMLCANALALLNALIRDAVTPGGDDQKDGLSRSSGTGEEWPKFVKRIQDLGVVSAVYTLMQSSALQDMAHALLEYQALAKVLLRKWREVPVDSERPDHRRTLKGLHMASGPDARDNTPDGTPRLDSVVSESGRKGSSTRRHGSGKWRRLGFESETPAWEFAQTGYLGLMDLAEYVRKHQDDFQKLLLEQSTRPLYERCPIARASLAVTQILCDHFEVDKSDGEDSKNYLILDGIKNYDKVFQPLLLKWSHLHIAGLRAFFRLWKATGAETEDFDKVSDLVRILIGHVVEHAPRTKEVQEVEEEIVDFDYSKLRALQMELLEQTFEERWGDHLQKIREELETEALQFVKEQRIRCLLKGAWFSRPHPFGGSDDKLSTTTAMSKRGAWRYVRLSPNRRYLYYGDFDRMTAAEPKLDQLPDKIDLSTISSVISNLAQKAAKDDDSSSISSDVSTLKTLAQESPKPQENSKITINTLVARADNESHSSGEAHERPVLTLTPTSQDLAAEWMDGLLMILDQAPITVETNKLVEVISEYGLKIRLLNVRLEHRFEGGADGFGVIPSREGLDDDYYYEV